MTADWIVSDTSSFISVDTTPLGWSETGPWLADQKLRIQSAIERAGITAVPLRHRPIAEQFPEIPDFRPRGVQRFVTEELPRLGPGLTLLCDQTGGGKTIAFLHACTTLSGLSGDAGFLVALPTTATTDAMYFPVSRFIDANAEGEAALTLMHSLAFTRDEYLGRRRGAHPEPPVPTKDDDSATQAAIVTDWLLGRRKGLLAPYTVCTIDQVLMVAIAQAWMPLPFTGIGRRTVVIDEVHANDAHMQVLFLRLLKWLSLSGVSVIAASASLPSANAQAIIESYQAGLEEVSRPTHSESVQALDFPGWIHVGRDGNVHRGSVAAPRERSTRFTLVHHRAESRESGDPHVQFRVAVREAIKPVTLGAAGNLLVVCNTVAAAISTYSELRRDHPDLEVHLLHSRFPHRVRAAATKQLLERYGADSARRPERSVVVSTQIAEQSLDIDLDLVVSQLAPMASLIQREGRCHRHKRARPPVFDAPEVVVLAEVSADGAIATPDKRPYDLADLKSAHDAFVDYSESSPPTGPGERFSIPIGIPSAVQTLVDAAYEQDHWDLAVIAKNAETTVKEAVAYSKAIPDPEALTGNDLHQLTRQGTDSLLEPDYAARYGLNTRPLLFVRDLDGVLHMDGPRGWRPLPIEPTASEVRLIMEETISVTPDGRWLAELEGESDQHRPMSWKEGLLKGVSFLLASETSTGLHRELDSVYLRYEPETGLSIESSLTNRGVHD